MRKHIHKFKRYSTKWHHYGITSRVESRYRCSICGKKVIQNGVDFGYFNDKGKRIGRPFYIGKDYLKREKKKGIIERLKKVV